MLENDLNRLLSFLKTNQSELSRRSGVERTTITKFASGSRLLRPDSKAGKLIIEALLDLAEESALSTDLLTKLGAVGPYTRMVGEEAIRAYLFGTVPDSSHKQRANQQLLSIRLDALMRLTGWSNAGLSRAIHVDSSLVSRWRTGMRNLPQDGRMASLLGEALYNRLLMQEKVREAAVLLGLDGRAVTAEAITYWLIGPGDTENSSGLVKNIVNCFDSFVPGSTQPQPDMTNLCPEDLLREPTAMYYGTQGLHRAVLRLLGNAALCGGKELLLYSDGNQDWLTSDKIFIQKWAALMVACLRNGLRIRIIHHLERNIGELVDAVRSWVPLYMSGQIESYYIGKTVGERFSHTLFLCPGIGCILGMNLRGNNGMFQYLTEPQDLNRCYQMYKDMLASAKPLIHTEPLSNAVLPDGNLTVISNRDSFTNSNPTIGGMPPVLRTRLLERLHTHHVSELLPCHFPDEARRQKIQSFAASNSNYTPILLQHPTFERVTIVLGDASILVIHLSDPALSFSFSHPSMCKAFSEYAKALMAV